MKFIDSSFEIVPQEVGLDGIYKQIEKAARVSYKSEDKITEGSDKKIVDMLMKANHGAALEHGTVYLKDQYTIGQNFSTNSKLLFEKYKENKYSKVKEIRDKNEVNVYITTNLRVLFENN